VQAAKAGDAVVVAGEHAAFDFEVGILERGLGREHPTLAGPLINRGLSYLDLGRLDEADVAWLHARALRVIGEEPERAVALGRTALTICRERLAPTPENRAFAAEIEAWLAAK